MLGWFSDEIARASRSKRSLNRSCVVLMATARPNRVSMARKTSPMPPCAEFALDTVGSQDEARTHDCDDDILQQLRSVLDGKLVQEFAGGGLREQPLYFAPQFGIGLGQQCRAVLGGRLASRMVETLQFAGNDPGSSLPSRWFPYWMAQLLQEPGPREIPVAPDRA